MEQPDLEFLAGQTDYEDMPLADLATRFQSIKRLLEIADRMKKEYQKEHDYLAMSVIPDRMDEENIDKVSIAGVGRLQLASDIRCNVPAGNRDEMKAWLVEHGHEAMVSETINASTLKAFVKEQIKNGNPWPEELLKVSAFSRASLVKG